MPRLERRFESVWPLQNRRDELTSQGSQRGACRHGSIMREYEAGGGVPSPLSTGVGSGERVRFIPARDLPDQRERVSSILTAPTI